MWTLRSTTVVYRGGAVQHLRGTRALVIAGVVGSLFPSFLNIPDSACFVSCQHNVQMHIAALSLLVSESCHF